jgi:putative two-component system response regulator
MEENGARLKLLCLEDSPSDAALAARKAESQGLAADWTVVGDEAAFRAALEDRWDVILLDYNVPGYPGMEALALAKELKPQVPVVFLSGSIGEEQAVECITAGATDYVLKDKAYRLGPVLTRAIKETETVLARLHAEEQVRLELERMERILDGAILAIAATLEFRDPYTSGHQQRTARIAEIIARKMDLSPATIKAVRTAGVLHDIGKISVPSEILTSPRKMKTAEYALIKDHPVVAYEILQKIDFVEPVAQIVLQHHERMDGSGYPHGIGGDEILMEARILAVADVVEAMASARPYRLNLGVESAMDELTKNKGITYDADAVDACLELIAAGDVDSSLVS